MNDRILRTAWLLSLLVSAASSAQPAPSGPPAESASAAPPPRDVPRGDAAPGATTVARTDSTDSGNPEAAAKASTGGPAAVAPVVQGPLPAERIGPENSYLVEFSTRSLKLGRTFGTHSVYLSMWLDNYARTSESLYRDSDTSELEQDESGNIYGNFRIGAGYDKTWSRSGFDFGFRGVLEYGEPYSWAEPDGWYENSFSVSCQLAATVSRGIGAFAVGGAFGPDTRWRFSHYRSGSIDRRYSNFRSHTFSTEFAGELFVQAHL